MICDEIKDYYYYYYNYIVYFICHIFIFREKVPDRILFHISKYPENHENMNMFDGQSGNDEDRG